MICPNCSYENSDDSKFCRQCGAPLGAVDAAAADDAPVESAVPVPDDAQPSAATVSDADSAGRDSAAAVDSDKTQLLPRLAVDSEETQLLTPVVQAVGDGEAEGESTIDGDQDKTQLLPHVVADSDKTQLLPTPGALGELHDEIIAAEEELEEEAALEGPFEQPDEGLPDEELRDEDVLDTKAMLEEGVPQSPGSFDRTEVMQPVAGDSADDPYEFLRNLPEIEIGSPEGADSGDGSQAQPSGGYRQNPVPYAGAGFPADTTAVMPPLTSKEPVRYSVTSRDKKNDVHRRRPRGAMVFAAILAVIAIAGVVYLATSGPALGTEVPDVVGMSADSARSTLLQAGFQVDVESQLTEDNFGIVLASDPGGGEKQRSGSTVTITVSASRTIPDVVGMDSDSAQNKLQEEGAENVTVTEEASNQPAGTVIGVDPKAGTNFNPADEITLTVAKAATVPDVVGQQQDEATSAVSDAGYQAEVKWADSEEEAGTVVSITPKAGTNASLGSTVTVYVASPGPRDMYHLFDYYDAQPSADSEYLQWKGFTVAGSYTYEDDGVTYASQVWQQADGSSISFTPVPYTVDMGLSTEDYLSEGVGYQGIRLYAPNNSSLSLGTDVSLDAVHAYMDACGFDNLTDSCTQDDVKADDGRTGSQLGLGKFICAQGETNGYVWTVLVTEDGAYLGCGPKACYNDMDPICDNVAINEMFTS